MTKSQEQGKQQVQDQKDKVQEETRARSEADHQKMLDQEEAHRQEFALALAYLKSEAAKTLVTLRYEVRADPNDSLTPEVIHDTQQLAYFDKMAQSILQALGKTSNGQCEFAGEIYTIRTLGNDLYVEAAREREKDSGRSTIFHSYWVEESQELQILKNSVIPEDLKRFEEASYRAESYRQQHLLLPKPKLALRDEELELVRGN